MQIVLELVETIVVMLYLSEVKLYYAVACLREVLGVVYKVEIVTGNKCRVYLYGRIELVGCLMYLGLDKAIDVPVYFEAHGCALVGVVYNGLQLGCHDAALQLLEPLGDNIFVVAD